MLRQIFGRLTSIVAPAWICPTSTVAARMRSTPLQSSGENHAQPVVYRHARDALPTGIGPGKFPLADPGRGVRNLQFPLWKRRDAAAIATTLPDPWQTAPGSERTYRQCGAAAARH